MSSFQGIAFGPEQATRYAIGKVFERRLEHRADWRDPGHAAVRRAAAMS